MADSMRSFVEYKVEQIKKDYLNNHERVISDYEREVEDRQSYHGRELLELLQNADDEMIGEPNPKAKISFDGNTLVVSNNGHPFSEKGISSLMLSNLSPKRKNRQLIGNKGTGFRSILSWAESIRIDSGDLHISFSPDHSEKMLFDLFHGDFPEEMTPATLAFPKWIDEISSYEYTTTISITIKDNSIVQNDIENQINKLNSEILIFLNNIKELEIESLTKNVRYVKSFDDSGDVIMDSYSGNELVDHQEWYMNRSDDNKYKNETFSVVIAYNKDGKMPENNVLHAYFPTKIEFPFPVLLHADFDVDNNRNHLINEESNTCILERAAEMLVETSLRVYADQPVSFEPLKFLIPNDSYSIDLKDHDFEESLEKAIKDASIFPTVNNEYVSYSSDLKFYTGSLAKYVYGEGFSDLLQYSDIQELDDLLEQLFEENEPYEFEEFVMRVNTWVESLPKEEKSLELIVSFIEAMLDDDDLKYFFELYYTDHSEVDYNLFFDSNYDLLPFKERKFITGRIDSIKELPSFIQTNSLHPVMEKRVNESEIIIENLEKLNIFEYSFKDIVDSANHLIDECSNKNEKSKYCNELLQWVYIYSEYIKSEDKIYLCIPNRSGKICHSRDLYFGKEYGNLVGERVVESFAPESFVTDICKIIDSEKNEAIAFLTKLGVAKYPKITEGSIYYYKSIKDELVKGYARSVIQSLRYPLNVENDKYNTPYDFYKDTKSLRISVNHIKDITTILSKARTKDIIAWIKDDNKLREYLYNTQETASNSISVMWKEYHRKDRTLECNAPSYLRYVFSNLPWIEVGGSRYCIGECLLVNDRDVDLTPYLAFPNVGEYVSDLGGKIKKHKDDYSSVLINLGMKEDFSELDVEKIYEVLQAMPEIPESALLAKTFYESILEDTTRKVIIEEINNTKPKAYNDFIKKGKVYCKNGNYVSVSDACYVSKRDVCESILDTVNVIDISGRVAYTAIPKLLGPKELKLQGMHLENYELHPQHTNFLKDFNRYKALAFTYRVNAKKDVKSQARKFTNLEVLLCSKIQVSYNNQIYELGDGEFFHESGNVFYLCCNPYKSDFHRAKIGSGIASILCSHLDVYDNRTDFRELYTADSQNDRLEILHDSFDDATIQKAKKIMNSEEDIRDEFINVIDQLSNYDVSTQMRLIDTIDFEDISSDYNASKIIKLFRKLEIDVSEFNAKADFNIELEQYYRKEIEKYVSSLREQYNSTWYHKLKTESIEQKSTLQGKFLLYDSLCQNISIRNTVYFEPQKELIEQLSIDTNCKPINLSEVYYKNREFFVQKTSEQLYVDDFLAKTDNASLLYYGEYDELTQRYSNYLECLKDDEQKEYESNQQKHVSVKYVDIVASPGNEPVVAGGLGSRKKAPSSTGHKDNRTTTKRIGRNGERLVYDELLGDSNKKYVRWVSENGQRELKNPEGTAAAGYDLEYTDEFGKRCYVEVKSTTASISEGISFNISASEYKFALDNSDAYYIYYVTEVDSDPKITILHDIFIENEFNVDNYSSSPDDYIISATVHLK